MKLFQDAKIRKGVNSIQDGDVYSTGGDWPTVIYVQKNENGTYSFARSKTDKKNVYNIQVGKRRNRVVKKQISREEMCAFLNSREYHTWTPVKTL